MNIENKKIRILLVIRWPVGGIRTFIRYVYTKFHSSGYEYTILAPDLPELKVLLEDLKDINVSYIPFGKDSSVISLMVSLYKTILTGNFDLIHSHGFTAGILSALPARVSKTKHIMTSHDVLLPKQFNGLNGFLKKKVLSTFLPMIDIIHSVGIESHDNLINFISSMKNNNNNCVVIPNGIEVDRFRGSDKEDFRQKLNIPEHTFLIGFFGRFMSQKGFAYLVEALKILVEKKDLPKVPILLTFGHGGFIREEKEMIEKKGLANYVHFLPFTPNVASSLRGVDVVAMPSLWEACALLVMESLVAGAPIIASDCIGIRESLKDTPGIMVPAANSIALADAIENEIRTPSRQKVEAFRDIAASRFDVRKQAVNLEKTILSFLNPVQS